MAAKYINTVSTADEKSELTDVVVELAKKRGTWMVSLYQR